MPQLAIAAAGAAIGSAFGYASIGWTIGLIAGQLLFPAKGPVVEGPRINDLKVQTSSLGEPIPIVYGVMRIAGNIIDASEIREHRHEEEVGGGKGGGSSSTQVTYSYDVDVAVGLCVGPIAGIRKIWADGKLLYDVSAGASIATVIASQDGVGAYLRSYPGDESQLPDPTLEAIHGAGNVSPHRGLAYVVFSGLSLTPFGNRIPNFTFEVVGLGSAPASMVRMTPDTAINVLDYPGAFDGAIEYDNGIFRYFATGGQNGRNGWIAGYVENQFDTSFNLVGQRRQPSMAFKNLPAAPWYSMPIHNRIGAYTCYFTGDIETCGIERIVVNDHMVGSIDLWQDCNIPHLRAQNGLRWDQATRRYFGAPINFVRNGDTLFVACWSESGSLIGYVAGYYTTILATEELFVRVDQAGDYVSVTVNPYLISTNAIKRSSDNTIVYMLILDKNGELVREDLTKWWSGDAIGLHAGVLYTVDYPTYMCRQYDIVSKALVASFAGSAPTHNGLQHDARVIRKDMVLYRDHVWLLRGSVDASALTVADIVDDLCEQSGIGASKRDTSALSDAITGFAISQPGSARAAIEQLLTYSLADCAETGGKLSFVKRGGAAARTFAIEDMSLADDGQTSPLAIVRAQEADLPRRVWLHHIDPATDYQQAAQQAQRVISSALEERSVQLAIAMSPNKAAQIADVLLRDSWSGRTRLSFKTGPRHIDLEPCDVIEVDDGHFVHRARIVSKTDADDVQIEAIEESASYLSSAVGASGSTSDQDVSPVGGTRLLIFDAPLLSDDDPVPGAYFSMAGYYATWPGGQLFGSADGQAWQALDAATTAAKMGIALNALGLGRLDNIFDEGNFLQVRMFNNAALAGATELQVLNGANAMLVGGEVIQYRAAALQSDGTYVLSGILRGRRGTEFAQPLHAAGESVLVLEKATVAVTPLAATAIGTTRKYRAVTFGQDVATAAETELTFAGASAKPLSPVFIGSGKANASDDTNIYWTRRARRQSGWANYVDVPLDESTERYDVELCQYQDGSGVFRTISSIAGTSTVYTAAQRDADATLRTTIFAAVYQLSDVVGRGFRGIGTVTCYSPTSVVLMHFDGTAGQTTTTDAAGHTVTLAGGSALQSGGFNGTTLLRTASGSSARADVTEITNELSLLGYDFTVEMWVKFSSAQQRVFSSKGFKAGTSTGGWALRCDTFGMLFAYLTFDDGSTLVTQITDMSVLVNTWVAIAFVREGSSFGVYVNGVLMASWADTRKIQHNTDTLRLGGTHDSTPICNSIDFEEYRCTLHKALYRSNYQPKQAILSLIA